MRRLMVSLRLVTAERAQYIPHGLLLQWHVTSRCNLRCEHCYQDDATNAELSFEQLLNIAGQYEELLGRWRAASRGARVRGHITITGGEPFVRADIWSLLEHLAARHRSFSFAILTNGTCLDAAAVKRLAALKPAFVQVSLDGGPATHDLLRGAGNFERVVSAIRLLRRAGIRTLISFTAGAANYREFVDVAHVGASLGVDRVWADRLIPVGRGGDLNDPVLSPTQTHDFFRVMNAARAAVSAKQRPRTEIAMHRALQFLCGGGAPYRCTAGDTLLALLPNGDVLPCRRMPIRVGNLMETSLGELYDGSPLLGALRDPHKGSRGCERCAYAKLCHGGLRCLSNAVHGDPFVADPGCWLAERGKSECRMKK
jgi:radical SAM protein with 4Fe4S-binding SPASM domain